MAPIMQRAAAAAIVLAALVGSVTAQVAGSYGCTDGLTNNDDESICGSRDPYSDNPGSLWERHHDYDNPESNSNDNDSPSLSLEEFCAVSTTRIRIKAPMRVPTPCRPVLLLL
jgi:hypothetical protein